MSLAKVKHALQSSYHYGWVLLVVLMSAAYCIAKADEQAPAGAPPAPAVEVMVVQSQAIRTWVNFSGRLAPVESAVIKPLVSGTIEQVLFTDGQQVHKGQQLFLIDPRAHQASVLSAQAQLATARSRAKLARDGLDRSEKLLPEKLVSQSLYDAALSSHQVAEAEVKQAEAALSQAQLNLEYAHVRAPIDGRVSRAELTPGNVVEAGANAPVLTQIVANDKFYAEFSVDEATYIHFARNAQVPASMPVELTLASDNSVVYQGHLASFDNRLDSGSGTIRARALFDNRDGALAAGMFANIRLGSAEKNSALLVPERAIGTNQSKKFVLVVDASNTASYREITLGDQFQDQRIVLGGVEVGDRVIVNGLSHVRPNSPVNPTVLPLDAVAERG